MDGILNDIVKMYYEGYSLREILEGLKDLVDYKVLKELYENFERGAKDGY